MDGRYFCLHRVLFLDLYYLALGPRTWDDSDTAASSTDDDNYFGFTLTSRCRTFYRSGIICLRRKNMLRAHSRWAHYLSVLPENAEDSDPDLRYVYSPEYFRYPMHLLVAV